MNTICTLILCIFASSQLQEVKLNDQEVVMALNVYVDSLNSQIQDQKVKYHLISRVEYISSKKIVYVAAVTSTGAFWRNLPDKYSKIDGRFVFWYESKNEDNNEQFRQFHEQFSKDLINDCSSEGNFDLQVETEFIGLDFIGTYRFIVQTGKISSLRKVCSFPDDRFYRSNHAFDNSGELTYKDGVYDICSLDCPYRFDRKGFDPMSYIRKNSGVSDEIIRNNEVGISITIDKKGKPIKAEIIDKDGALSEQQKLKLADVVLKMPNWNPQTVNKKKVYYRILTKL